MEDELQKYIEKLKETSLESKDTKKTISRIKDSLDHVIECYEAELKDGDITKEEILKEFIEEYKKDTQESPNYQTNLSILFSKLDTSKQILKNAKTKKHEYETLLKLAKKLEKGNSEEPLYHSLNTQKELMTILRVGVRASKKGVLKGIKQDDIISIVSNLKKDAEKQIREKMQPSLEGMIYFLNEYGYIDEYIKNTDDLYEKIGLSGLKAVKRNPLPSKEYDTNNLAEKEDLGIIDYFKKEQLDKLEPSELMLLELFWKAKYFNARMEISEAMSVIEHLDLWPMLLNKDKEEINNIDDKQIESALKRDMALTYLLRNKAVISPKLEEKYIKFLEKNNMTSKGTTYDDIEKYCEEYKGIIQLTNDIALSECVVVDKLLKGEMGVKKWGYIDNSKFTDIEENEIDKFIIAIEHPNFRGPLLISVEKEYLDMFLEQNSNLVEGKNAKYLEYKENIDEKYSYIMANLWLPNSTYFKKYVAEKYQENPDSQLYTKLATDFANCKKIKTNKKVEQDLDR